MVVANLAALMLLGFGICAWILFYTDVLPEVVGLLSLGGVFAWGAFLANLLTEDRKKELQKGFEARFLLPRRNLLWIAGAGLLFFLGWAPMRGSIVVATKRDDKDRTINLWSQDQQRRWTTVVVEEEHLTPRSQRKYALPTPWFGAREFRVKISGLPARIVQVHSWRRKTLRVPVDFGWAGHPTVLIHPTAVVAANAQKIGGTLSVRRGGELLGNIPYRGESVWVGCDEDVEIPESVMLRWRLRLQENNGDRDAIIARWNLRRSIAPEVNLSTDDHLDILYQNPYGQQLSTRTVVAPPYPQEVTIDVPH